MSEGSLFDRLRRGVAFVVDLIRDPVTQSFDVPTAVWTGMLFVQVRRGKDGRTYIVFKTKGGEATVWNAISTVQAREVAAFLTRHASDESDEPPIARNDYSRTTEEL